MWSVTGQLTHGNQTQKDYIIQFVHRVHPLLEALLSREALPAEDSRCHNCPDKNWAVWRCADCVLVQVMCRSCIRAAHTTDPFHKIQKWTGQYFRAAELWEVGSYILVPHRTGLKWCSALTFKVTELEKVQRRRDFDEQRELEISAPHIPGEDRRMVDIEEEVMDDHGGADEEAENAAIDALIDQLYADHMEDGGNLENPAENDPDDGTDIGHIEDDVDDQPAYLQSTGDGPATGPSKTDALLNPYVRVVHINGMHQLPLVSCLCRSDLPDELAYDLVASRMIPASFDRIRTIFTAQMLDYFRLCNLELKATAYQFNQLLRRITLPMAPSQVLNLYNELRRMSRLWRWMKRLKWNGFGHNGKDPMKVQLGELAIYCPTCPQPGINIPDNWKEDVNRFVYRRLFVADGNFKADHVRQPKSKGDHWLSEGGGMDPQHEDYMSFLQTAFDKPTVRLR